MQVPHQWGRGRSTVSHRWVVAVVEQVEAGDESRSHVPLGGVRIQQEDSGGIEHPSPAEDPQRGRNGTGEGHGKVEKKILHWLIYFSHKTHANVAVCT